jgi:transposase
MDADRERQLVTENADLKRRLAAAEAQIVKLAEQVGRLTAALEQARREGKRQAAPFRKPLKTEPPKKPGRKAGEDYGQHHRKAVPAADEVTERHRVPLPTCCDNCQSTKITPQPDVTRYQFEIPQQPIIREFTVETGCCEACGKTVQGRHELETSNAAGAAQVQWGPRAHAAMAWLNKRLGLSHGKIKLLFEQLFDVKLGRATSARSAHRSAARCAAAHEQARQDVRGSPQVVPDETGWRVGGGKAWLHGFPGLNEVVYVIDPTRSGQPAEELLGLDFAGLMVRDGWSPYNAFANAVHQQCNAHLLRRCNELLETATGAAARFPRDIKELLLRGLAFRDRFQTGEVTARGCAIVAGQLTQEMLCLLAFQPNAENEKLAKFLYAHEQSIFNYLRHPGMDATNWRGEHAMRIGVVNRKVWGGNRTWRGAATQSVLMTVIQTCTMRGHSAMRFLENALTATKRILLPPPKQLVTIES